MRIEIARRDRPFSHEPGTLFLVPHTTIQVRAFPVRIEWEDLATGTEGAVDLGWTGPIKGWTAQLDLEKGELILFGKAKEGRFSHRLKREGDSLYFDDKQLTTLAPLPPQRRAPRIFLGSNKAQDLAKMRARQDLQELLPLWWKVASLCPSGEYKRGQEGHYALLEQCRKDPKFLEAFFLSALSGAFVPRLVDTEHQGIVKGAREEVSALPLLLDSAKIIGDLFYCEGQLLPLGTTLFPSGRVMGLELESGVQVSFEWTKRKLRKLMARATSPASFTLVLPKGIKSCRDVSLRKAPKKRFVEKGKLELSFSKSLYLDRFE